MLNPPKFDSLNLDTPSSRYEFLKLVINLVKKIIKSKPILRLTDGARGQRDPPISELE